MDDTDLIYELIRNRFQKNDINRFLESLKCENHQDSIRKISELLVHISAIMDISTQLNETLSLDLLLQKTMDLSKTAVGAERGTVFVYDRNRGELFSKIQERGYFGEIRIPYNTGIAGTVFTTGQPVIIPDAYADPRFNQEVDRETGFTTRNILCAPIKSRHNDIIGVTQLLNKTNGPFDQNDLDFLQAISAQTAAALQNAQIFEEVRKVGEDESMLLEITAAISSELQLKPLLQKIMETVTSILNADRSTLFIYDDKNNELWSHVAQGLESKEIRIPTNKGIAGHAFTHNETINILDAHTDPRFNPEIDRKTGYHTKSILCMPVTNKRGQVIGVVQVLNKRGGPFSDSDVRRLRAFSSQASVAIENAKLFDEVLNIKNYNESILQSLNSGVITLDANHRIEKCNDSLLRILNVSLEDFIGRNAHETFAGNNDWILASIKKVVGTGKTEQIVDSEYVMPDNKSVISVNISVVPLININKELIGSMLIFDDISHEKRLRGTLSRYMPKEVADQLLKTDAVLGGKIQEVSVLFSDIRNFTTMSEKLGAQTTVSILNEYFSTMVDIIFAQGGTLDKYIGDAILAVFGIPFANLGDADHSVQAAIQMYRALKLFNQSQRKINREPLAIGIGINTGKVLVGNIGSIKRMDYTCIGKGVNLASRLESINKYFGTQLLISHHTYNKLQHSYITRVVDLIRVMGAIKPVTVYEILDYHDETSFPKMSEALAKHAAGLEHYRQREWQSANKAFQDVLRLHPHDGLAKMYCERCCHFAQHPPPQEWDGVWVMEHK